MNMKKSLLVLFLTLLLFSCKNNNNKSPIEQHDTEYSNKEDSITLNKIEENENPIGSGTITTIADGFDVKIVNLWSSSSNDRKIIAKMSKGDKVHIIEDNDPYYYIELVKSNKKGYCMKGFVTSIKWNREK